VRSLPPEGLGYAFVVALLSSAVAGEQRQQQAVSAFDTQLSPALEAGDEVAVRARAELEGQKGESAKEIADVARLAAEDASRKKGIAGLFGGSEGRSSDYGGGRGDDDEEEGPEGHGRAIVVSVDASRWRPRFTVRLSEEGRDGKEGGGATITVTDRRLSSFPAPPPPPPPSSSPAPRAPPKGDPTPPFAAAHAPPPPPPPAAAGAPPPPAPAPPPPSSSSSSFAPSLKQITEAVKAAKCAVSSLQFEDVSTGVRFLREALELLTVESAKGGKKK
jgi:hypothetical protein